MSKRSLSPTYLNSTPETTSYFTYIYKHDFKTTWETLKDIDKTNIISNCKVPGYASQCVYLNNKKSWEVGADFSWVWKKALNLNWRCLELLETENYNKIKWHMYKTEPNTFEYYFTYNLYSDCRGTQCVLVIIIEYSMPFTDEEEMKKEKIKIYENIDNYLTEQENKKIQTEVISIKSNFILIWKILLNLKLFKKLVNIICDELEYEGDYLKNNTNFIFKWRKNKIDDKNNSDGIKENNKENESDNKNDNENFIIVYLRVKNIFESENHCRLVYESVMGSPPVPQQEIEWEIEKKDDEICFVKFTHKYKEAIRPESLEYTSILKKKILNNLKNILENENENSEK